MNKPAPLVPAHVNLQKLDWFPLNARLLRDSRFAALAPDAAFKAALVLWCVAWHQLPAGSLPNDDKELAYLAGYPRDVEGFLEIKEWALFKWVECEDGRLYHPVLAKEARVAWDQRLLHLYKQYKDRVRKHNKELPEKEHIKTIVFSKWRTQVESGRISVDSNADDTMLTVDPDGEDPEDSEAPPKPSDGVPSEFQTGQGQDRTKGKPKPSSGREASGPGAGRGETGSTPLNPVAAELPIAPSEPTDTELAEWMFATIKAFNPSHKKPNFAKWADDFRLMREQDNRPPAEIVQLYQWVVKDDFWRGNVLSPAKLREQYDRLVIKRGASPAQSAIPTGGAAEASAASMHEIFPGLFEQRGEAGGPDTVDVEAKRVA